MSSAGQSVASAKCLSNVAILNIISKRTQKNTRLASILREFSPSKVLRYFKFNVVITKELLISVGEMLLRPQERRNHNQIWDVAKIRVRDMKVPSFKHLSDYSTYVKRHIIKQLGYTCTETEWDTADRGDEAPYGTSDTTRIYRHLPRALYWFFKKNVKCVKDFPKIKRPAVKRRWWLDFYRLFCLMDRVTDPYGPSRRLEVKRRFQRAQQEAALAAQLESDSMYPAIVEIHVDF